MVDAIETKNVQLTNDTLKNIYIMAPLLSKDAQNRVLGMMFGILSADKKSDQKAG